MNAGKFQNLFILTIVIGNFFILETTGTELDTTPNVVRHPQLEKGVFLIANKGLSDPNFSKTVVLITQYDDTGTAGLIINRPLSISADKVFPNIDKLTQQSGNVHIGGPVQINNLQLLVQSHTALKKSTPVFADIYLVNTPEAFLQLLQGNKTNNSVRLYAGYAGWATGQLESELLRGDWYLWPADTASIFTLKPTSIWQKLIDLASAQWVKYAPHSISYSTIPESDV